MNKASKAALLSLVAALAACSDGAVAPRSQPRAITSRPGGSTASLSAYDTLRFSFVIDPSQNLTYPLGQGNTITFPAGSLCDPTTSSYGVGTWDQPCSVASSPLTEYANAWLDSLGHPHIDFTPSIRFVPSANPTLWVVLSFTDDAAAQSVLSAIEYCPTASGPCVDEALSDPSLATYTDSVTGQLTRRIKHFSGYNVAAGVDCTLYPGDPSCSIGVPGVGTVWLNKIAPGSRIGAGRPSFAPGSRIGAGRPSFARESGFMLASGRDGGQ